MRDILIGLVIILAGFIIVDFVYTEKSSCPKVYNGGGSEDYKCGFLKKQLDIELDFLDRFW